MSFQRSRTPLGRPSRTSIQSLHSCSLLPPGTNFQRPLRPQAIPSSMDTCLMMPTIANKEVRDVILDLKHYFNTADGDCARLQETRVLSGLEHIRRVWLAVVNFTGLHTAVVQLNDGSMVLIVGWSERNVIRERCGILAQQQILLRRSQNCEAVRQARERRTRYGMSNMMYGRRVMERRSRTLERIQKGNSQTVPQMSSDR